MNAIITARASCKDIGRPLAYFEERQILLDCRGEVHIHADSHWGFRCMVLTSSHDISDGDFGRVFKRKVIVERGVWIGSGVILYNCVVGENSVVSVGSVLKNVIVPPNCLIDGNPAKIIAVFQDEHWFKLDKSIELSRF